MSSGDDVSLEFVDDRIRCSIVVSISACHAEDPGSIPGGGGLFAQDRRGMLGSSAFKELQAKKQLASQSADLCFG